MIAVIVVSNGGLEDDGGGAQGALRGSPGEGHEAAGGAREDGGY